MKRKFAEKKKLKARKRKRYETTIADMPDEILLRIVNSTPIREWPTLELIDRRFRKATIEAWNRLKDVRLSTEFGLDPMETDENKKRKCVESTLELLLRRKPSLPKLACDYRIDCSLVGNVYTPILNRFTNLQSIDLVDSGISLNETKAFLRTQEHLRELNVNANNDYDERVENGFWIDAVFCNAAPFLPRFRLETFSYIGGESRQNQFWRFIDVSRLTTLNVTDTEFNPIDFAALLKRTTKLKRLVFNFMAECNGGPNWVEHVNILEEVAKLEDLECLKIGKQSTPCVRCMAFENEFILLIDRLGRRRRLKELDVTCDWLNSDGTIIAIGNELPFLKYLALAPNRECTTPKLIEMLKKMGSLERLALEKPAKGDFRITGDVVTTIATNLVGLKKLRLGRIVGHCRSMRRLSALVNLEELNVRGGGDLDHLTWKSWSKGFGSTLKSLEIYESTNSVDDKRLAALVKNQNRLRRLKIPDAKITDTALYVLARRCPNLRELDLANCESISVAGLQAVVDGCPNLAKLTTRRIASNLTTRSTDKKLSDKKYWMDLGVKIKKNSTLIFACKQ